MTGTIARRWEGRRRDHAVPAVRRRGYRAKLSGLIALVIAAMVTAIPGMSPARAQASCVAAGTCQGGGGTVQTVPSGQVFCIGGIYNGRPICSGPTFGGGRNLREGIWINKSSDIGVSNLGGWNAEDAALHPDPDPSKPDQKDPYIEVGRIRDRGATLSSATGTIAGLPGFASRTNVVGGGADAAVNLAKTFNLAGNQYLSLAAGVRYDQLRTTFDDTSFAPGGGSPGSVRHDLWTVHGSLGYRAGTGYFGVLLDGRWGDGSLTDNIAGATGSFNSRGFSAGGFIGNTFALFDSRQTAPPPLATKGLPVKALPKQADSGYAVLFDLRGRLRYSWYQDGGFTDSAGFIVGDEVVRSWVTGVKGQLSFLIPAGNWTVTPFIAGNVDHQFGFSHRTDIPGQPGQAADTIYIGNAQTFAGVSAGIDWLHHTGWDFGVKGSYQESSQFQVYGGQAFIKYYAPPGQELWSGMQVLAREFRSMFGGRP